MNKKKLFVSPKVLLDSVMTSEGQGSASYFGSEDADDPDADLIIEW